MRRRRNGSQNGRTLLSASSLDTARTSWVNVGDLLDRDLRVTRQALQVLGAGRGPELLLQLPYSDNGYFHAQLLI